MSSISVTARCDSDQRFSGVEQVDVDVGDQQLLALHTTQSYLTIETETTRIAWCQPPELPVNDGFKSDVMKPPNAVMVQTASSGGMPDIRQNGRAA